MCSLQLASEVSALFKYQVSFFKLEEEMPLRLFQSRPEQFVILVKKLECGRVMIVIVTCGVAHLTVCTIHDC